MAGKSQANSLRSLRDSLIDRWLPTISKRKLRAVEKYIASINTTTFNGKVDCKFSPSRGYALDAILLIQELHGIQQAFDSIKVNGSDDQETEKKVNRLRAALDVEKFKVETEIENWKMRSDTAMMRAQFINQCQVFKEELKANLAVDSIRQIRELLFAGAEVKLSFPKATKKVVRNR